VHYIGTVYLPVLWFVFLLIEMLKTLNEEINPHHSGFAVAARNDNDVQTIGFHACDQTIQTVFLNPNIYIIIPI